MSRDSHVGRPPGSDGKNRETILSAARKLFASKGFDSTTMRAIANGAGVDVALVAHYFGSKAELFSKAMDISDVASSLIVKALSGPADSQGLLLTQGYLGLWEDPQTSAQMKVLGRSALTNDAAAARIRAVFAQATKDPELAPLLEGRELGFMLAMSHLLGLAIARHLVKVPLLADVDFNTLVTQTAPAIDAYLNPL